ncbi:MAG: 16S rRNA methyltransferase [Deltaproteobacteria bacterium]|nr:16S rRNA methyltransferase [Deltaproteobacteria bacterium]
MGPDSPGGATGRAGSVHAPRIPGVVGVEVAGFEALLADLGIAVCHEPASEKMFVLGVRDGALDLRPPGEAGRPGIRADFPPDRGHRSARRHTSGAANLLVRAFGRRVDRIFDLTAGLGADAYRLAGAGYRVQAVERHPAVFALLASGWARACEQGAVPAEVASRLEFVSGEAESALRKLAGADLGVYLDPMYPPPRRRSALPKREIQVLRQLVGLQDGVDRLIDLARARAARVVVKRPHHAEPLASGVSFELESKLVRFDVYVNPEKMTGGTETGVP